jgi:hypothetical protein
VSQLKPVHLEPFTRTKKNGIELISFNITEVLRDKKAKEQEVVAAVSDDEVF